MITQLFNSYQILTVLFLNNVKCNIIIKIHILKRNMPDHRFSIFDWQRNYAQKNLKKWPESKKEI